MLILSVFALVWLSPSFLLQILNLFDVGQKLECTLLPKIL